MAREIKSNPERTQQKEGSPSPTDGFFPLMTWSQGGVSRFASKHARRCSAQECKRRRERTPPTAVVAVYTCRPGLTLCPIDSTRLDTIQEGLIQSIDFHPKPTGGGRPISVPSFDPSEGPREKNMAAPTRRDGSASSSSSTTTPPRTPSPPPPLLPNHQTEGGSPTNSLISSSASSTPGPSPDFGHSRRRLVRLVFKHGLQLSSGPVEAGLLAPATLLQGLLEGQRWEEAEAAGWCAGGCVLGRMDGVATRGSKSRSRLAHPPEHKHDRAQ